MARQIGMFSQKLAWCMVFATAEIVAAMVLDYVITILILKNYAGYTPLITLAISTVVAFPVTFTIVSAWITTRHAHDELAIAHRVADEARAVALQAVRDVDAARQLAVSGRAAALEASRAKSEFLANMCHELRTPLNAIIGFSEMLKSGNYRDKWEEYSEIIHVSGRYLLSLINDILDLSKIEAGKYEPHDAHIRVHDLVRDCVLLMQPRADAGGISLRMNVPQPAPVLLSDLRSLRQIILNLLSNAIKFTRSDGEVIVGASIAQTGEFCFEVSDTGVGIAEDDLARVFENFGQGRHDVVNQFQGTGLGLPIVRGLVQAQGGRVTLESAVDSGTCVRVFLPANRVQEQAKQVA